MSVSPHRVKVMMRKSAKTVLKVAFPDVVKFAWVRIEFFISFTGEEETSDSPDKIFKMNLSEFLFEGNVT